jgi:putative ABC transport system substrate-binding protein
MGTLSRYFQDRTPIYLLSIAAFVLFFTGLSRPAHAFNVIVVKSAELKPYKNAVLGFKDACKCDVREVRPDADVERDDILHKSPVAVVAIGTSGFKKVRAIRDLPVVYTMVMPAEVALSLRPNISGVSMDISPETYVATMKEVFPGAKRVGLLYDPRHTEAFVEEAAKAARAAGLELVYKQVRDPREIPGLLDKMQGAIDVLWMVPDATIATAETVDYLLHFSFQHSVPIFSFSRKYVEMGAVAALEVDPYDMGAQAGEIVKKLAEGGTGAIRVWAHASHLTVNRKVAAKMGLKIKDEIAKKVENVE